MPRHTRGHTVLLYRDRMLFTGDHLAMSTPLTHLYAFRPTCWYSWPRQIESMKTLANYTFEWVLPGHSHRFNTSVDEMKIQMQQCIAWMEAAT